MKKTTYILIGLVILSLVMVFISPFALSLFKESIEDKYSEYNITLSQDMTKTETAPFEDIEIDIMSLGHQEEVTVIVRQGDSQRVFLPVNIVDISSITADDGKLKVQITNPTKNYHYLEGDTLMIIETPSLSSIRLNDLNRLKLEGFKDAVAKIDFKEDIFLDNCQFASLKLINAGGTILRNSKIRHAEMEAESNLKVRTTDSAIDSLIVTSNRDNLRFSYGDSNIGNIQIVPNNNTISLILKNPVTINNSDYGTND